MDDLNEINYTPERNIEVTFKKASKNTLWVLSGFLEGSFYDSDKGNILSTLGKKLQILNKTYWTTKELYKYTIRDDWERYFDHVNWVLNIYIDDFLQLKEVFKNLDKSKEEDVKKAINLV